MVVEVKNLGFGYRRSLAIESVNWSLTKGDFVALLGPNGSGKSTLVKLILGFLQPQLGSVTLYGQPPHLFKDWKRIGYVPQGTSIEQQFPGKVKEILSLKPCNSAFTKLLGEWSSLGDLEDRRFSELSGGERQRVLVTLALRSAPELLVLDEPEAGMDAASRHSLYALLSHLNDNQGMTVILVSHEVALVPKFVKSILCLNNSVCFHGSAQDSQALLRKVYGEEVQLFHQH